MLNYTKVNKPAPSLLPKTKEEWNLWFDGVKQGWVQGIDQASQMFSVNLNRIKRDYVGMNLYRILLAKNMVTSPFVSRARLGITGGVQKIRINDQVLRIAAPSTLKVNSHEWKPILIHP